MILNQLMFLENCNLVVGYQSVHTRFNENSKLKTLFQLKVQNRKFHNSIQIGEKNDKELGNIFH